jgi:hypothetical protein
LAAIIAALFISAAIVDFFSLNFPIDAIVYITPIVIGAIGMIVWMEFGKRDRIKKALSGKIENCLGKYVFDFTKSKYIASSGGKAIESPVPIIDIPGTYKFYYLKKPTLLLSVEPCDRDLVLTYDPQTESLYATLQRAIGFNVDDLSANRNGELSERQRSNLKRGSKQKQETVSFVIGRGSPKPYGQPSTSALAVDLAMNLLGALPNAVYYFAKAVSPAEKYFFYVGDKQFEVLGTTYAALIIGLSYKAYFLAGSNKLLSIEQVST